LTPLEKAVVSLLPTAYSSRPSGTSRRLNQISSGNPMVNTAPGTGPTDPARCWTHPLPLIETGFGATNRTTPWRLKNIASVTTIAWTRSTMMSRPFSTPTASPRPRTIGTETAPPSPFGTSQTM
jgi:hypothetical protein